MARMKGITPIIAIIILLLITIALAATAWTFMSGLMTSYTRSFTVVDSYCSGSITTTVRLRYVGTGSDPMSLGDCSTAGHMTGTSDTCGSVTISKTDGANFAADAVLDKATIKSGEIATFTETCTTLATPKMCSYRFAGMGMGSIVSTVSCG